MLLQVMLSGKAQSAYFAFTVNKCGDYETVKEEILKAYQLVTEVYCQNFWNYWKDEMEIFTEFFKQKEIFFNRCSSSEGVGDDHEKLKQLVIIEDFKNGLNNQLKLDVEEKRVRTAQELAVLADEYVLTHKTYKSHENVLQTK